MSVLVQGNSQVDRAQVKVNYFDAVSDQRLKPLVSGTFTLLSLTGAVIITLLLSVTGGLTTGIPSTPEELPALSVITLFDWHCHKR